MIRVLLFNKPYGALPQFTDREGRPTLGDHIPLPGFYPAGRLDMDSEGLMVLTNDGRLQHRISHPRHKQPKTYWVEVEGVVTDEALARLTHGVELKDGMTLPATAKRLEVPALWPRQPPVRFRKSVPTGWIELTISEGRNRQVRRMTAAVGLPTLRLVRVAVGPWTLEGLEPGQWRELSAEEVRPLLPPPSSKSSRKPPARRPARRGRGQGER